MQWSELLVPVDSVRRCLHCLGLSAYRAAIRENGGERTARKDLAILGLKLIQEAVGVFAKGSHRVHRIAATSIPNLKEIRIRRRL